MNEDILEEIKERIAELFAKLKAGLEALIHHGNEFRKKYIKLTPEQKERIKAQYAKSMAKSKDLLRRLFSELHKLFIKLKAHLHKLALRVDGHLTDAMEKHVANRRGVEPAKMHEWASQAHNSVLSAREAMEQEKWEELQNHINNAHKLINGKSKPKTSGNRRKPTPA
jgi:uncharacterized protein YpbB